MFATRLAKAVMVTSLAAFAFIVTFDNVTDYASNFDFVRHILTMDTTFPNNALLYRSIKQPPLWHVAYLTIIAAEGLTCLLLMIGAAALLRTLHATGVEFDEAKRYTMIGGTLAFLVWFAGFTIVGGEWFAMWQSKLWNGQEPAFRFYMTALAVLIFVNQSDARAEAAKT